MIPHRQIAALRADDTPQRHAQAAMVAAMAAWRASPAAAPVLADLATLGTAPDATDDLTATPTLAALFAPGPAAARFAAALVAANLAALADAPLGQVAIRHFTNGVISTVLIARSGRAALTLSATDGNALARQPTPTTIRFPRNRCWEHVLAGGAQAHFYTRDARGLHREDRILAPGTIHARDGRHHAMLPGRVTGCLAMLRLEIRLAGSEPVDEVSLPHGELAQRSAGSPTQSRHELMMALLGRMERADAAPVLARIARDPGVDTLRWQALRECLGLDTATGFAALSAIAANAAEPLATPAGALRARLIETHPQLAAIADPSPCLA